MQNLPSHKHADGEFPAALAVVAQSLVVQHVAVLQAKRADGRIPADAGAAGASQVVEIIAAVPGVARVVKYDALYSCVFDERKTTSAVPVSMVVPPTTSLVPGLVGPT